MSKEKRKKVGFQMYPLDWWSSETFFNVDDELLRYWFIEMMFLIYNEGGFWRDNRPHFEKRMRRKLSADQWRDLSALFIIETLADGEAYWHHDGISKRLDISPRQIVANRVNWRGQEETNGRPIEDQSETKRTPSGKRNGHQSGDEKETKTAPFKLNQTKPKETEPKTPKGFEGSEGNNKPPNGSPSPLWALGTTVGSVGPGETWKKYGEHLQKILPDLDRERMAKAWRNYWPYMADPDRVKAIEAVIEPATDEQLRFILDEVGELLILGDPRAFDDPIEFATGYLKP